MLLQIKKKAVIYCDSIKSCILANLNLSSESAQTLQKLSIIVSNSIVKVSTLSGKRLHSSLSPPLIPANILRTVPRSRVSGISNSSRSIHRELDKDAVLDFGISVAPSFLVMDFLPEVSRAPLLSSVSPSSPSSPAPPAWFAAFQAKFKQYEERRSQLGSVVAPAPTPGEAYGKSNKLVSSSTAAQAKPKVKISSRHRKAAARIFVVSAPPVGGPVDGPLFEHVYLPNKYRAHLSVFRQKLRLIGLDNSRVLDVHYPALDVIALLIHTAYKEGLLRVMNKYSLSILLTLILPPVRLMLKPVSYNKLVLFVLLGISIEKAGIFCWNFFLAKSVHTLFSPGCMEGARPGHSSWSSVIDLFISFDDLVDPSLVAGDAGLGFDYVLVSLFCSLSSLPPVPAAHPRLLWKLSCLYDHKNVELCKSLFRLHSVPIKNALLTEVKYSINKAFGHHNNRTSTHASLPTEGSIPDVDSLASRLTDTIHLCLDESVVRKQPQPPGNTWFWTSSLLVPSLTRLPLSNGFGVAILPLLGFCIPRVLMLLLRIRYHSEKLSRRKAPGVDHLRTEMLLPLVDDLSPISAGSGLGSPVIGYDDLWINSLLYAGNVVLIDTVETMPRLLKKAEEHSLPLGYRWNPAKYVVVNPPVYTGRVSPLRLYGTALPVAESFDYLGLRFNSKAQLGATRLVQRNACSAMVAMRSGLQPMGVHSTGFSRLTSARLYVTFIRPKLEHGLAVSTLLVRDLKVVERAQDLCLRLAFGGHSKASTVVFRHLTHLPSMKERVAILGFKMLVRMQQLPSDTLLAVVLAHIASVPVAPRFRCPKLLQNNSIWKLVCSSSVYSSVSPSVSRFPSLQQWIATSGGDPKPVIRRYRRAYLAGLLSKPDGLVLLRACRPVLGVDPILLLPMTAWERSRLLR
ncbi:hypothetical protein EDC96DRAFT_548200 [Choanephora cucurbitarum]|nr:hypothetical protein EDC96DRAFT_548200 [Choanephora cucurbitarum]